MSGWQANGWQAKAYDFNRSVDEKAAQWLALADAAAAADADCTPHAKCYSTDNIVLEPGAYLTLTWPCGRKFEIAHNTYNYTLNYTLTPFYIDSLHDAADDPA